MTGHAEDGREEAHLSRGGPSTVRFIPLFMNEGFLLPLWHRKGIVNCATES